MSSQVRIYLYIVTKINVRKMFDSVGSQKFFLCVKYKFILKDNI